MKKYSKYSDSGIKWIGDIPEHWEVRRLITQFIIMDYLRAPISSEHRSRKNPLYNYYGASGVIDKIDYYNIDNKVLLIGEDGANLVTRSLPLIYKAEGKFWVNNHAHILKPKIGDYDYMAYLLESLDYSCFITGAAQPKLNQENLKSVQLCIPPLSEQQAIADFLDKKIAKIDNIISTRKKQIELLIELKKTIISNAITKGLDPQVKKKDSGIDWIGEMPEHWEVRRLNEIGKYRKGPFGSALKVDTFVNKDGDTIKVYEQQNAIRKDAELGKSYISREYFENNLKNFEVIPGDLIVSCAGTIGETYLLPSNIEQGIINQALMRMRMKKENLNINYFLFIFDLVLKEEATKSSNGSAIKNIPPFDVLKKIKIPVPPLSEQQDIVNYIETKERSIDESINKFQKQIDLLTEYRTSLISEAVTGKIDVRDI